jgi:hypothetical protein
MGIISVNPCFFLLLIADSLLLIVFFIKGESMKKGWQFLSLGWWVVHFLGFALIYTAGRLTAAFVKG